MVSIHSTAKLGNGNSFGEGTIIGPNTKIGSNNIIGKYVLISGNVTIGDGNIIGEYVSISGNVIIGNRNVIGTGSVLGWLSNHAIRNTNNIPKITRNQVIEFGNENLLGEFVTVHTPVVSTTYIGNNTNVGTRTHIAHDVTIEDRAIINSHSCLAGYVTILKGANIGIGTNIHPRIIIGQYSMIGLGSAIIRHILPGATVAGNPQIYIKPNSIGMKRNELSARCIEELSQYLNEGQVILTELSSESQWILKHFLNIRQNNKYVRSVPWIPSCVTFL